MKGKRYFSPWLCMPIEELVQYHAERRKQDFRNGRKLVGVQARKRIHWLITLILKIDQLLSKEKICVLYDNHTNRTSRPLIFACTHIGGNDIQRAFQVIKRPSYLMLGDPGVLYKKLIFLGLKLNGVIPLETADKEDRSIAYERSLELLNRGGNLLIYPEGAWNVSPNAIVMKTFAGTVRIAQSTGAEIVPIGMEQYGNTFYICIGQNHLIPRDDQASVDELNTRLRDCLASLKWDVMETQPIMRRKSMAYDGKVNSLIVV